MAKDAGISLGQATFNTLLTLALGCGIQTAVAPTVIVSCPARTAAAPDCNLRWLIAFDILPVRQTALPALQSIDQIERNGGGGSQGPGRPSSGATFTVYFRSAAGRTRAIWLGDYEELRAFREPIVKYLSDPHASPLEVTMWPNRFPWWWFASVVIGLGLLQGTMLLARIVRRTPA
jgi:hypothetical protein